MPPGRSGDGVDQPGQQCAAIQIDNLGGRSNELGKFRLGARTDDFGTGHGERLDALPPPQSWCESFRSEKRRRRNEPGSETWAGDVIECVTMPSRPNPTGGQKSANQSPHTTYTTCLAIEHRFHMRRQPAAATETLPSGSLLRQWKCLATVYDFGGTPMFIDGVVGKSPPVAARTPRLDEKDEQ